MSDASLGLPQAGHYAELSAFVLQCVKPVDKFFSLADGEHVLNVSKWILSVNSDEGH